MKKFCIIFIFSHCSCSIDLWQSKKILPDGELNPGLPRDRRGYSPLYYRGLITSAKTMLKNNFKINNKLRQFLIISRYQNWGSYERKFNFLPTKINKVLSSSSISELSSFYGIQYIAVNLGGRVEISMGLQSTCIAICSYWCMLVHKAK